MKNTQTPDSGFGEQGDQAIKVGLLTYLESTIREYQKLPTTSERRNFLQSLYEILVENEIGTQFIQEEGRFYVEQMDMYRLTRDALGHSVYLVELPIFMKRMIIEEFYNDKSDKVDMLVRCLNDPKNGEKLVSAAIAALKEDASVMASFIIIAPSIKTGFKIIMASMPSDA